MDEEKQMEYLTKLLTNGIQVYSLQKDSWQSSCLWNSTVKCVIRSVVWEYGPVNNSINTCSGQQSDYVSSSQKFRHTDLVILLLKTLALEFQQNIGKVLSTKSVESALFVVYGHFNL